MVKYDRNPNHVYFKILLKVKTKKNKNTQIYRVRMGLLCLFKFKKYTHKG